MTDNEPELSPYVKRRSNFVLRALVDEMLEQVRALDRASGTLDLEQRAVAEKELDALMARVRRAALKGPAT